MITRKVENIPLNIVKDMEDFLKQGLLMARRMSPPGDGGLLFIGGDRDVGDYTLQMCFIKDYRFKEYSKPAVVIHAFEPGNQTSIGRVSAPVKYRKEDRLFLKEKSLRHLISEKERLDKAVTKLTKEIAKLKLYPLGGQT